MSPRVAFLWATLLGSGASTVFRTTHYKKNTSCGAVDHSTEYFGVLDGEELLEFDKCLERRHNSTSEATYSKYACINGTAVADTYTDGTCSVSLAGDTRTDVSDSTCVSDQTTSCAEESIHDIADAAFNFSILAVFYSDPSCTKWAERAELVSTQDYAHPASGVNATCAPVDVSGRDMNGRTVCVEKEIVTMYYKESDTHCTSDPVAMALSPRCTSSDEGDDLYVKASCVNMAGLDAPEPNLSMPLLAEDSAEDEPTYTVYRHYKADSGCTGEHQTYYREGHIIPGLGYISYGSFGECSSAPDLSGYWVKPMCIDDRSIVYVFYSEYRCAVDYVFDAAVYIEADDCREGEIEMLCNVGEPIEGSGALLIDEDAISVTYYNDGNCTEPNGNSEVTALSNLLGEEMFIFNTDADWDDWYASSGIDTAYWLLDQCSDANARMPMTICVDGEIVFTRYMRTDGDCEGVASDFYFPVECSDTRGALAGGPFMRTSCEVNPTPVPTMAPTWSAGSSRRQLSAWAAALLSGVVAATGVAIIGSARVIT